VPALNALATMAFDAGTTYGDRVHIVHIYIIEPHPMGPDVSPYSGAVWEGTYGTKPQAYTYDERVSYAREVEVQLEGTQLMLVDDLVPGERNNPVWCTYGPCPNCSYLIRQDGIIDSNQMWLDAADMKDSIDSLL